MADLVVLGLGYVGLPLAARAASTGVLVEGLDVNRDVVDGLNSGSSHIDDLEDVHVQDMLKAGFRATTEAASVSMSAAVVICVPTPLSPEGGPDLGAVVSAARAIAPYLRPGVLVVLESTTYPGTTEAVVKPILEEGSGLIAGRDFHLAYSPERIDPGNQRFGVANTPKVVGGLTDACREAAVDLYRGFIDTVVPAKGMREAEAAKLLENTYRHVNIALVNEMAKFFHELRIDFWDVIRLASTKPFGFQPFYPGPGVGGHCIPIDPNYLNHHVRSELGYAFRFVELAQEINATMPAYVAQRAQAVLNDSKLPLNGSRILLLGVTYKPDIADQRESPAIQVAKHLIAHGASVSYHDPFVKRWEIPAGLVGDDELLRAVEDFELVILLQHHSVYDADKLASLARRFFDTRGVTTSPQAVRL